MKSLRKMQARYEPSSIQGLLDVLSSLTAFLVSNIPCKKPSVSVAYTLHAYKKSSGTSKAH